MLLRRPRSSTLFPYTTLFRSRQARAPRVPLGGALVGVADAEDRGLAEGPAHDLHPQRQAVAPEAVGQGEHRLACDRSEEHTSELQSQSKLVCRLLLE